ncbi:MAG TPA: pyridoxamine 5'-phosphate oxidase family protein [Rhizomicrobium sp.]|nr:pyridoxamine 5'-phosphate oxidase family protein [Rhizomicrobium sp.]
MRQKLGPEKKAALVAYLRNISGGVISTVGTQGAPEAALITFAVSPELEIVFETLVTSRKYANLQDNPRAAFVAGGAGAKTIQIEGLIDEPAESDLDALKRLYYESCPQNLSHRDWPGMTYLRLRPRWIRFSDYGHPWHVEEYSLRE